MNSNGTLPLNPYGNKKPMIMTKNIHEYECCCNHHCEYRNIDRLYLTSSGEADVQFSARWRWESSGYSIRKELRNTLIVDRYEIPIYYFYFNIAFYIFDNNEWRLDEESDYCFLKGPSDIPSYEGAGCYINGSIGNRFGIFSGIDFYLKKDPPKPMPYGSYSIQWTSRYSNFFGTWIISDGPLQPTGFNYGIGISQIDPEAPILQ